MRRLMITVMTLSGLTAFADSTWIKGSKGGWADENSWSGGKPTTGSTVIVPADCDMPVTDDDMAIAADVAEIKTSETSSRVVFNINSSDATYNGKVTGSGYFVKDGLKTLSLTSTGTSDYYTDGGTVVNAGGLKAPQTFSASYSERQMKFGHLFVAKDAIFYAAAKYCQTTLRSLTGNGVVKNMTGGGYWPMTIVGASTFEGSLQGYLSLTINSQVDFLSSLNEFSGPLTLSGSGADLGGVVFGSGTMSQTSIGRCINLESQINPITFTSNAGRLRYLGTGETAARTFKMNTQDITFDGGPNGNLKMNCTFKVPTTTSHTGIVTFGGTNAEPCEVIGSWPDEGNRSTYIKKTGDGTWIVRGTNLCFKGVVGVAEGTFGFDNLAEPGTSCSFGLSTKLAKEYKTGKGETYDDAPKADYAILLGSEDHEGTIEYVGTPAWDNGVTNRPVAVTGKGGRILVNGDKRMVAFKGAFAADADGATLTLDGTSPRSYLYDVSDKHGPLSLVKEGTGTWVLGGDQTFSGKLDVKGGELIISSTLGKSYSWYRFTVRETCAKANGASDATSWRCRELTINDKNGKRLNRAANFTEASTNAVLSPGQIAIWQNSSITVAGVRGPAMLVDEKVNYVADDTYYADILCGGKYPRTDDRSTWIPIVMRLPEGSAEVAYYDAISHEAAGNSREPCSYTMEASADGVFWDTISDVTSSAVAYAKQNWWTKSSSEVYNTYEAHKGIACDGPDLHKSLRATDPVQNFALGGVSVAAGAILKAEGSVTLQSLEVDATGAGTVDGFAFASGGTINVTGSAGAGDIDLPLMLANVQGTPDFSGWAVKLNGRLRHGRKVEYANGKLKIRTPGTILMFR